MLNLFFVFYFSFYFSAKDRGKEKTQQSSALNQTFQKRTQPSEEMISSLLTEPDGVCLCCPFPIGRLFSLDFSTGQLVTRDQRVIGWGLPCDIKCVHTGSNFQLIRSKDHLKKQKMKKKELIPDTCII